LEAVRLPGVESDLVDKKMIAAARPEAITKIGRKYLGIMQAYRSKHSI